MDKVVFAILINIFITAVYCSYAEICNKVPANQHCIIEYMSRERWPHKERYFYNPSVKKCVLIRWSDRCELPPPSENNFGNENDCKYHCPGVPYQNCMKEPENKQCIIDEASRQKFAHKTRYYYNWDQRKCLPILWLDSCNSPEKTANNFEDERTCSDKCSGYA